MGATKDIREAGEHVTTREGQAAPVKRSGWLTFSAVVLIIAGIMRVLDAIWAFRYHGAVPNGLKDATLGHSLATYGWVWLITGAILIAAGAFVLGPSARTSAEISTTTRGPTAL